MKTMWWVGLLVMIASGAFIVWPTLYPRETVSSRLPQGLSMSDRIGSQDGGNMATVEEVLAGMGAHINADGILVDAEGWRIEFRPHRGIGAKLIKDEREKIRRGWLKEDDEDKANKVRVIYWSKGQHLPC